MLGYNKALRNAVEMRNKVPYVKSSLPFALPDTVDWRLKNVVTEVKDQCRSSNILQSLAYFNSFFDSGVRIMLDLRHCRGS